MNYTVCRIYITDGVEIDIYSPSEISLTEIKSKLIGPNCHAYISVRINTTTSIIDFDLSHYITDFNTKNIETWNEFNNRLTDQIVNGYKCDIPGYSNGQDSPRNPVKLWDATNVLNTFILGYSDHLRENPSSYNLRWKQLDLSIKFKPNTKTKLDLTRCIPVVNGVTCRRWFSSKSDTLYALDGARCLWQSGEHITPEVQLLDFTSIGQVEVDDFTLTQEKNKTQLHLSSIYNECRCETEDYNLREYTPLVVLCGCLIWSKDISIIDEHHFTFSPSKHCLEKMRIWKQYIQTNANSRAEIAYDSDIILDHIKSECSKETSDDCFVYYVKTSNLFYRSLTLKTWDDAITIDLNAPVGILIRNENNSITAFHCNTLVDRKELIVQNLENIYSSDNVLTESKVGFLKPDCQHHKFKRIQDSKFTMLYVMNGK